MEPCKSNENNSKLDIDLSIIPVTSNKIPFSEWKPYQKRIPPIDYWYEHYSNDGYIGIITGKISGNLECIDVDVKNDPTGRIAEDYLSLIPKELYDRLIVQNTPNRGLHLIYRCPDVVIEPSQKLALHTDGNVIIETRGEGGYFCTHINDYNVDQGVFNLVKVAYEIPVIIKEEREFLLDTARTLDRHLPVPKKPFTYKVDAINQFNEEFDIIKLFKENGFSVTGEYDNVVYLLRDGSLAHHSGIYMKDQKVFFCFSTSTAFTPKKPYNHYQVMQVFHGVTDHKASLKILAEYGYESKTKATADEISVEQIAEYLNNQGVRYNEFIQDITLNGKILEERDNNTLYLNLQKHFEQNISRSKYEDTIKSHFIKMVHPVKDFIEKYKHRNPMGTFEKWVDCLVLKNQNIDKANVTYFIKKWYVGMIAQALGGEYPNEFFLSFLSTKQGIGKTTLVRKYLLPKELQEYLKETSISDDEDFKLIMSQCLVILDDEMDGRTLSEDKTFKAILSRMVIAQRRKYDRRISNLVRRCSFIGSGNNVNIVRERQNRRIIPIELESIDQKGIAEIDLIDLFIEAYQLFMSGFRYSFDGTDSANIRKLADDYVLKSDLDEVIDEHIDAPKNDKDVYLITSIDIMNALNSVYPYLSRKITAPVIGKILSDKGIESKRCGAKKTTKYPISLSSSILNQINQANTPPIIGFESRKP